MKSIPKIWIDEKKQATGYIDRAKSLLKEGRFDDAEDELLAGATREVWEYLKGR